MSQEAEAVRAVTTGFFND